MKGWGLIKRKECWGLTLKGWLAAVGILALAAYLFINSVYGFLAINHPLQADILVVESWLPDFAIAPMLDMVEMDTYEMIVAAGGIELKGSYLSPYPTTADQLAATLAVVGIDSQKILVIRNPSVMKDRTYTSALKVSQWLSQSNFNIKSIDLVTIGAHARRSRLLFGMALGEDIEVGVVNIQDINYDPQSWWRSSTGLRTVLGEFIAYLYAKFFFYP